MHFWDKGTHTFPRILIAKVKVNKISHYRSYTCSSRLHFNQLSFPLSRYDGRASDKCRSIQLVSRYLVIKNGRAALDGQSAALVYGKAISSCFKALFAKLPYLRREEDRFFGEGRSTLGKSLRLPCLEAWNTFGQWVFPISSYRTTFAWAIISFPPLQLCPAY